MGALIRLIVLAAVVWLVISFIRRSLSGPGTTSSYPAATAMHPCSYCQVNIPETECTRSHGRFFCSDAHRDAWLRQNP